ncbi:Biosynthetic peptidoglycan transglycosylase GT51 [Carnimonas sp. R-84981]|uniref:monofunctional biosynthetic peptidoglycan transglycosylase n=1 Tax=Carnimonas bestiolae TaxID=3402172 RepID=UPI003EDC1606
MSSPFSNTVRVARKVVAIAIVVFVLLSVLTVLLFRWVPIPVSSVMVERQIEAAVAGRSTGYRYQWVSYEDISPQLKLAVIASEDQRFPYHHGFDEHQMALAWRNWRAGEALRGASTISQQTAKNVWLWTHSDLARKGVEAWFTLLIENLWSKQRILEVYLNLAEWGDGVYGAQAAARYYFHTDANALSAQQAALLASVLPAPRHWSASRPNARVANHSRWVLRQMRQLGGTRYLDTLH